MAAPPLTEQDWDRVFELALELCGKAELERRARLRAEALSAAQRCAVELHLQLGEPPLDPHPDRWGERVGACTELRQHLRDGGAGAVYLGVRQSAGNAAQVAVKLLRVPRDPAGAAALAAAWHSEQRFLREFAGSRRLPGFIEAGEHTGPGGERFLYLCTEYKYGLHLRQWCEENARSSSARVALFLQVCDAVATIHQHGLVHGDLRPENIQVEAQAGTEHVWILDLGLATIQGQHWPAQRSWIGSPSYLCPEQVCSEYGAVSPASDVYALGAILFELLEGRPHLPWQGELEAAQWWERIRARPPVQLERVGPEPLRERLAAVLQCALQLRPQDRYVQVSALREALRQALAADPPRTLAPAALPGCAQCAADPGGAARCASCAGHAARRCLHCGLRAQAGRDSCGRCGAPLPTVREERKHVTALVVGPCAAPDEPPGRAARPALAPAALGEAVRAHGGTLHGEPGASAQLALFGAPAAREDHALAACLAALALARASGSPSALRAAIHSGELLVREAESGCIAFDPAEDVLRVVRRLWELTGAGEIRISERTLALAEGYVQVRPLDPLEPAGSEPGARAAQLAPLQTFQLLRNAPTLNSWKVRGSRALTQFVEREPEMAVCLANLHSAERGERRVLEIAGEPGVGKSRLVHELALRAEGLGWAVARGAADSRDELQAYATLARLVRSWLEVDEHEPPSAIAGRLEGPLALLAQGEASGHRVALHSLLGLEVRESAWQHLEPPQRRVRIAAAMSSLASAAAAQRPLLWIAEDLHWADAQTLGVLQTLCASVRGPLLVLLSYRTERSLQWSLPGCNRLHLGPLSPRGGERILDSLMGFDTSLAPLKARLRERAGGNPLFLEESVRSLADGGVLRGRAGAFRFEGDLARLHVPASIHGVIASRIDRLAWPLKASLQLAALIGAQFSLAVLRELAREPQQPLDEALEALTRLGFVYPVPGSAEGPFCFQHALIHQVVYESVPQHARVEHHARIVRVIERLYPERLAEHVSELAEHALQGQLWADAARYRLAACIAAHDRSPTREVLHTFDSALATLEQMPQEVAIRKYAIDLRLVIASALVPLGEHARLADVLLEAQRLAEKLRDPRRLAAIYNRQSVALWLAGSYDDALCATDRAGALARQLRYDSIYHATRFVAGQAHHCRGEFRACISAQLEVVAAYSGPAEQRRTGWPGYPSVFARTYLIDSYLELGMAEEAERHVEEGTALADRFAHAYSHAMLRVAVGRWLLAHSRVGEALHLLEATLALCLEHDVHTMVPSVSARLAVAQTRAGELTRAQATLSRVLRRELLERTVPYNAIEIHRTAAELQLQQGDARAALRSLEDAEALCTRTGSFGQLAHALAARARAEQTLGASGEAALQRALRLCARLEMAPLQRSLRALAPLAAARSAQAYVERIGQ